MAYPHKIKGNGPLPASVLVTTCDRIPLSLFCPGGLAIVINFVGCPYRCNIECCPWDADLEPKNARTIKLPSQEISSLVSKYNPDLVFFHGAEPYLYSGFLDLIKALSEVNAGVKVHAKLLPRFLSYYDKLLQELRSLVLLIEVTNLSDIETLHNYLHVFSSSKTVLEFVILAQDYIRLHQILLRLINTIVVHRLRSTAINIVPISTLLTEEQIFHLVTTLREKFIHIYVPSSHISELASVYCHKCRLPIVVRRNYTVIKFNIGKQGECKYCHSKVLTCVAQHKLRILLEEVIR